jgi:hypothetical protein
MAHGISPLAGLLFFPAGNLSQIVRAAEQAGAAREEVIRALTVSVAYDPARPAWKRDSFFRRYAAAASTAAAGPTAAATP